MLLREDSDGILAIGQPSHAWISGQLARAWGNERFGAVEPFEEVCLAAEQHDVGWMSRELAPLFNPDTGLPRSFLEMPFGSHFELFRDGPRHMLSQSRYAALLVSLHGWRLYERRNLEEMAAADADRVRRFLDDQRRFQEELIEGLRADPATAGFASPELIERNSMLVWTWDYLSLALCLNWPRATARRAPSAERPVDLELSRSSDPDRVNLSPWPFSADSVEVHCEGRRLTARFEGEHELREALATAPWETVRLRLEPR
jgi:hypothetical protein